MFAANILLWYCYASRCGHFRTTLIVFGYFKHHPKEAIEFYTQILYDKEDDKLIKGWKDIYPLAKEKFPKDAPTPKEDSLKIIVEVDSDETHDMKTRRFVINTS